MMADAAENSMNCAEQGIRQFADIRYLEPGDVEFELTPGGFVSLRVKPDEEYERVQLFRAFPFSKNGEYISVRDEEGKEIGIIRSMGEFPARTRKILSEELERRYFLPIIERINSLKQEFGYYYWEVETDCGKRQFTTRRDHNSLVYVRENHLLIIDVDGNRFQIPDLTALDGKSYRLLEMLL